MGYYTHVKLSFEIQDGCKMDEGDVEDYLITYVFDANRWEEEGFLYDMLNNDLDSLKWYGEMIKGMKDASLSFPDVLFIVHGEGEENTDIWDEYYLNGKYYKNEAIITMPEFDISKLE